MDPIAELTAALSDLASRVAAIEADLRMIHRTVEAQGQYIDRLDQANRPKQDSANSFGNPAS